MEFTQVNFFDWLKRTFNVKLEPRKNWDGYFRCEDKNFDFENKNFQTLILNSAKIQYRWRVFPEFYNAKFSIPQCLRLTRPIDIFGTTIFISDRDLNRLDASASVETKTHEINDRRREIRYRGESCIASMTNIWALRRDFSYVSDDDLSESEIQRTKIPERLFSAGQFSDS